MMFVSFNVNSIRTRLHQLEAVVITFTFMARKPTMVLPCYPARSRKRSSKATPLMVKTPSGA